MNSISQNLLSVIDVWKKDNRVDAYHHLNGSMLTDMVASFFCPGDYYYFILDFFDLKISYVHPSVETIMGCKPEDFSFDVIFSKMHPEDAARIQQKESVAIDFFYNRISPQKIPFYKSTYNFRIKDNDRWKTILHQSIALQVAENGKIHHSLSIHSDITFLNPAHDDRISFIGINGEPSFLSLNTSPDPTAETLAQLDLSNREKEVIKLLADGLSSKQIADKLFISPHTVDTHRRNLLKKTGAKNTLELTAMCLKLNLI